MTRAVRGAIQIITNEKRTVHEASLRLVREILSQNKIRREDIVSIVFSLTADLDAGNPATGIRENGFEETPLFCVQEARVEGGMPRIIRALVTYNGGFGRRGKAVYLEGAQALRPDIASRRST